MMVKANQSFTGVLWDSIAQSPYATYKVSLVFLSSDPFACFNIYQIETVR